MHRTARFLILPLVLISVSCSSDRAGNLEHAFRTYKESGLQVSLTAGGVRYPGEIYHYARVLEIRENPDNPESLMKEFVYPQYGPDGRYYFLDINGSRMVVFDADGTFRMVIGQQGEGPGDLMYPTRFTFRGGTINIIQSTSSPRITRFNPDGSLHEVITVQRTSLSQHVPRFDISDSGDLLLVNYIDARGEQYSTRSASLNVTTQSGDTLATISTPPVVIDEMVTMDLGRGPRTMPVRINYSGFPTIEYSEIHGAVVSTGIEPVLLCFDLSGNQRKRIELDLPPEPVTASDRQALEAEYDQVIAQAKEGATGPEPLSVSRLETFRDNVRFADQKAFWGSIQVDEAGWFWLLKPVHDPVDYERPRSLDYRILNDQGEYIGDTTLPSGHGWGISHDRLIIEEQDIETGERSWIVYRITSAVEGLDYP